MTLPPCVYHVTFTDNLKKIRTLGLQSAAIMLQHGNPTATLPPARITSQRTEVMRLADGSLLRDQKPMPPSKLQRCLIGMTAPQWYSLLNGFVFFWCDKERLEGLRRAYPDHSQTLLEVDTVLLLKRHRAEAYVSRINTGAVRHNAHKRGRNSLVPIDEWSSFGWMLEEQMLGRRVRPSPPAELMIKGSVPEVIECLTAQPRLL
jgi:Family of unknown function (DUF7002)